MTDTTNAMPAATRIVDTTILDHTEWLTARRDGIGGSDAAAICGLSKWKSPFAVWVDKVSTEPPADTAGEAARWGTILEPIVRDEVATRTQLGIVPDPWLYAHAEHDFMRANIDGLVDGEPVGIYEGKTGSVYTADGWDNDQIPTAYQIQIQHYLAVTGLEWALCGVLIGGQRLEIREVGRDDELIGSLITIEADFWGHVTDGTPPPLDGTDATTDLLGRLYEPVPGKTLVVDLARATELIAARQAAADDEKAAKAEKDRCSNELRALLGDATEAVTETGDVLYTWRPQERTTIDTKRLKTDHPDLATDYSRTTETRTLRITTKKAKPQP